MTAGNRVLRSFPLVAAELRHNHHPPYNYNKTGRNILRPGHYKNLFKASHLELVFDFRKIGISLDNFL